MAFPTTQWSLIAAATLNGDREGREALNELCRRYRAPVLAFFRSKTFSQEDAEDLTQNLFRQILEKRTWLRADSAKGRFRSFLLTIAANAYRNWSKAARAEKRGNGLTIASLDLLDEAGWEPHAPEDGASLRFDMEWAASVMAAAWRCVETAATASPEKAARFAILRRFLPGRAVPPSYEAAAAELRVTVEHVRTLIHRLRDDFRSALRREVADTLLAGDDLDDEMTHLLRVMTSGHDAGSGETTEILKRSGTDGPVQGDATATE